MPGLESREPPPCHADGRAGSRPCQCQPGELLPTNQRVLHLYPQDTHRSHLCPPGVREEPMMSSGLKAWEAEVTHQTASNMCEGALRAAGRPQPSGFAHEAFLTLSAQRVRPSLIHLQTWAPSSNLGVNAHCPQQNRFFFPPHIVSILQIQQPSSFDCSRLAALRNPSQPQSFRSGHLVGYPGSTLSTDIRANIFAL